MKIVQPYASICCPHNPEDGVEVLRRIERYARLSHRSEERITPDSWMRLLKTVVMEHGDLSVIEHEFVTVFVLCDRGVSHEIVRHRVPWQYTQESTRFCNYGKLSGEIDIVQPIGLTADQIRVWGNAVCACEREYLALLAGLQTETIGEQRPKLSPQMARSVLPNSLATRLYMTSNLRGWRHFFLMRTSAEAHPQMRQVMDPLLKDFQSFIPLLFDDIVPGTKQSTAMKSLR